MVSLQHFLYAAGLGSSIHWKLLSFHRTDKQTRPSCDPIMLDTRRRCHTSLPITRERTYCLLSLSRLEDFIATPKMGALNEVTIDEISKRAREPTGQHWPRRRDAPQGRVSSPRQHPGGANLVLLKDALGELLLSLLLGIGSHALSSACTRLLWEPNECLPLRSPAYRPPLWSRLMVDQKSSVRRRRVRILHNDSALECARGRDVLPLCPEISPQARPRYRYSHVQESRRVSSTVSLCLNLSRFMKNDLTND